MKSRIIILVLVFISFLFSSCEKLLMEKQLSGDAENNFKVLSEIIKDKYSYLKVKDIDWDRIVNVYRDSIRNGMSIVKEFQVYDSMLYKLRDGHVNLASGFNVSRNWEWYLDYPPNFDWNIVERAYLKDNYLISGGLKWRILEDNSNFYGYVYYGSFSSGIEYIDLIKRTLNQNEAKGIIIDVRNNGGGYLKNAKDFASHFADKERLAYLEFYKTASGPNDFSEAIKHYIEPKGEKWNKPIVVLTNRKCYSATSFFVTMMKVLPNVTVLGDVTGGGAGLPVDYTLPNGWYLRFSCSRCTDVDRGEFELGVEPHIKMDMAKADIDLGVDTYIEAAKEIIDNPGI